MSEILGWQEGRRLLYQILQAEPNLSSSTMLYRAIEYAYARGAIEPEFFALGESDAMHHLRRESGPQAGQLIETALRWKHYPLIHQTLSAEEDPRLASLYDDWKARKLFTDRLAEDLGIPATELALYVGRDRGEKAINLPFTGQGADAVTELFRFRRGLQRLALFAERSHSRLRGTKKVARLVERAIADLPESDPDQRHVFF